MGEVSGGSETYKEKEGKEEESGSGGVWMGNEREKEAVAHRRTERDEEKTKT